MDGKVAVSLFLVFIILVIFCIWKHVRKFKFLEELGYPHPKTHFFFGNAREMNFASMKPVEAISKWKKEHGNIFGFYTGTKPTLVITDLDLLQKVLIKDFDHFTDHFFITSQFDVLKDSILTIKGDHWMRVRKAITPTFSPVKLKRIHPIVVSCISEFDKSLTELLKHHSEINIQDHFKRFSLDIIGQSILAINTNCQSQPDNNLLRSVCAIISNPASTKMLAYGNNIPGFNTVLKWVSTFHPLYRKIVQIDKYLKRVVEIRNKQTCNSDNYNRAVVDILQLMVEEATDAKWHQLHESSSNANKKCKPILTNKELVSNCLTFLLAGTETTATTLTYVAYMLAIHDKIQEKVYQEIARNIKDVSKVTFDDLGNLPYMDQVINEILRILPPFWTSNRLCTKDYNYNGRKIPKGMKIDIPIYNIHHDPDIWPEPETFDPERFSAENRNKIHPAAHMPFGLGPRTCIGMRFAMIEIKAILVTFLSKYKLEPSTTTKYPLELVIQLLVMCPKHELFVKLTARNL